MERLTQYFEVGNYTEKQNIIDVSNKLPLFENGVIMGKAIDRLAEFEDFMEEQNIKDLDLLKSVIELAKKDRQTMQKYLSMWKKLKEFIITNRNSMFLNDMPTARMYLTKVLDRMQELENGE